MTLLYGRDANGNQVPLLVDGNGIVQTSGGSTSWPGTSSQLTAGDGTAVNVGSGLSLAAGTLTASGGWSTAYSVDFTSLPTDAGPWGTASTTTTRSIDGKTWSVVNGGSNLGASLTQGTGLQFVPAANSGNCWLIIPLSSLITTVPKQFRLICRMNFASNADTTATTSNAELFLQYDGLPISTANRVSSGYNESTTVSRSAAFQSLGAIPSVLRTSGVTQPNNAANNMFAIEVNGQDYSLYQGPSSAWNGNPTVDMANAYRGGSNTNAVWGSPEFTNLSTCAVGWYVLRASGSTAKTITITNLIVQTLG